MNKGPKTPDEADLLAAEARVAHDIAELRLAARDWVETRRDAAVSMKGLTAAAAAGFTIGTVLFRRKPAPRQGAAAPAVKGSLFTMLAGLIASAIRSHYGDPLTIASRLLAQRRAAQAAGVPMRPPRYPTR